MRESRTYGSGRGACDETHVPTATCASRKLVRSSHSSWEADEQSGAIRCGVGGAKGGDQGECGPTPHAPDSEPDKRDTGR